MKRPASATFQNANSPLRSEVLARAAQYSSLAELLGSYKREKSDKATTARAVICNLVNEESDSTLYLQNVLRQMPRSGRGGAAGSIADFWISLYAERSGLVLADPRVQALCSHEFTLSILLAADKATLVLPKYMAARNRKWTPANLLKCFQIHNADISLDPIPSKIHGLCESNCKPFVYPGGLTIFVLVVASGRSSPLANTFNTEPDIKHFCLNEPWHQHSIEKLRYLLVKPENGVALAEGTTNEVRRTSANCHVNFSLHTDWVRDLMTTEVGKNTASLLANWYETFKAMANIPGLGAFRALHICCWLFIAYGVEMNVPSESLEEFLGSNVASFADMCQVCDTSIMAVFKAVQHKMSELGVDFDPVRFEIWTRKVVNIVYALNMCKQPSLAWRRNDPAE